jgi:phage protein D
VTATLYPVFFVRIKREGAPLALRVVEDASTPAEGEQVIRAKITQLVYEDNDEKADTLKLTVDNFDLAYWDTPWVKPGDLIKAKWGYPGNMSGQVEAVVTKVRGNGHTLTIEANGKEYLFNKTVRPRTWPATGVGVKRSDVVRAIAAEYGYTTNAEVVDSVVVLPHIIQAKLTDHQMLVELAKREGYVFYIDANGLYWGPRKLNQPVLRTIDRSDLFPPGFTVESDLFARPGAVTAKGRDPDKKKDFKATADNDTTKGQPVLAGTREVVDERTGATSFQKTVATATTVATTAKTEADAKRQVAGIYQNSQLGAVKGSFGMVGDPTMRAKSIVQLTGFGSLLVGKYYLTQVVHTVGPSSYTVKAAARREAMNAAGAATKAVSKGAPNKNAADAGGGDKLKPREVIDGRDGSSRVEYR